LFGWVAGFNNRTQPARQTTHSLSLRIRQRRRTIHEDLTRDAQVAGNLGERRTLTPRAVLTQILIREEAAGGLVTDLHLDRLNLSSRMAQLDMHGLVDYGALLLNLVQPVIDPNVNAIGTSCDTIRHPNLINEQP